MGADALSPIDLVPDFIPILGYLDDLILLPLGITLVIRLIPEGVMKDARVKAAATFEQHRRSNRVAGAVIIGIGLLLAVVILRKIV